MVDRKGEATWICAGGVSITMDCSCVVVDGSEEQPCSVRALARLTAHDLRISARWVLVRDVPTLGRSGQLAESAGWGPWQWKHLGGQQ